MTNIYATSEKKELRHALLHFGLETLRAQGYAVRRAAGHGGRQVYEATKGDETLLVALRTSQNSWFAFPRLGDDNGWLTLDEVDHVLVASVDAPHQPSEVRVHLMPAEEVRARFEQARRARLAVGNVVPLKRGMWLSLYSPNVASPVSYVGGGLGLDYPPIATRSLAQVLDEALAAETLSAEEVGPDEDLGEDGDGGGFDLLEAKRQIARALGVPVEAVRITVEV